MTDILAPALPSLRQARLARMLRDMAEGSPLLTRHALAMAAGFLICLALPLVDDRLFNGINVWHKPAKFFLSLSVHMATLAWALSLIPRQERNAPLIRWSTAVFITAAWLEMAYITLRAARAEASHFNTDSAFNQVLYSLMGLGSLSLTIATGLIGFVLWWRRGSDVWCEAAGLGLMLGAVLGTVTGLALGSGTSHWIGGDQTDATGLPLFFWSTTGGDLRVAHFIGLHAMQLVPLAALTGRRGLIYGMAGAVLALTIVAFVQAQMGIPLLRA
ncbi:MAG: hypothetical protein LCH46_09315 [Proteobacteria bacterium]|nr:hypothetical protein [Pseudomonadota bacterium]